MYNTNIILKTIFTLIFIVVAFFIDNYYLFWLLEFYLILLTVVDINKKALLIDGALLLVLLFVYYNAKSRLIIIALAALAFLVLYITSFTKRDLWKLKYEESYKNIGKRKKLFMDNFKIYLSNTNNERLKRYDYNLNDELLEAKLNSDAEDLYKYSKVRFYGYGNTITSLFARWNIYDLIYSIVSIGVLVLIYIFW
jgi:hypothetical protein